MKARLNLFQATILRWRALHPYNAVHVVRMAGSPDRSALMLAIGRHLEALGLTGLELDRNGKRYEWRGGASAAPLDAIDAAGDADEALRREIVRQLNLAYPPHGSIEPFRFFAIDDERSFWFGVAYDHFVAGGDSIVTLLSGIAEAYRGGEVRAYAPLARYPPTYGRMFLRQVRTFAKGLSQLSAVAAACKRSCRPPMRDPDDCATAFIRFRLDRPECDRLSRAASAWNVTQNDLFLAVLLMSLAPLADARKTEPHRREIAVASIVNIRRDFGPGLEAAFGPILASFRVSHDVPDTITLRDLVRIVNAETIRIKRGKLYLQTLLALALAGLEWRFLSPRRRRRFFAKHYPVWAGTTPLNVTALWQNGRDDVDAPDYVRAVPTGPIAPIALAITTAGHRIDVGLTYRTTAFDDAAIHALAANMRHNIATLEA